MTISCKDYDCWVPFHLADPGGVLFFGNAFALAHQAFENFVLNQLELPWTFWFQNPDWIIPIRHAQGDFVTPLLAGKECRIEITINAISHSSFTLTSTFYQTSLCCSIQTVHIFCDRENKQKIPIPSSIRDKLSNLYQTQI